MAPGSNKPMDIGSLLAALFRQKNWHQRLGLHAVFQFWDETVGKDIAMHARPYVIRGTVLWVKVRDSVWMQQLQFEKPLMLQMINQRLSDMKLTDIRFQLESDHWDEDEVQPDRQPASRKTADVDPERQRQIEGLLASIEDEEIRKTVRQLWLKQQGQRQS